MLSQPATASARRLSRCGRWLLAAAALLGASCASAPGAGDAAAGGPILTQSAGTSHWPVEGETRPGLFIRFEPVMGPVPPDVLDDLRITVEHGGRSQVITAAAFTPVAGGGDSRQSRYLYTPLSGTLFLTLELRPSGRWFHPDTQRIELNDDCWHLVSYRIRGEPPAGGPPAPPPYPRTVLLTGGLSPQAPVFLDVHVTGNCFRRPLPPRE